MNGLRQEDFFPLILLVPVAILFPLLGRGVNWERYNLSFFIVISCILLALAVSAGLAYGGKRGVLAVSSRVLRDLLPLFLLAFVYANVGFLQAGYTYDAEVLSLNAYHLGFQDFELVSSFGGKLTADFFALVYLLYIPIGVGYMFHLYSHRDNRAFRAFIVPTIMTHYLAFLSFLFIPLEGPKYFLHDAYPAHLHGDLIGPVNAWIFESARSNTTDCFPSLHTALFVHMCLAAWGWDRKSLPFLAMMTLLTMVACVYLWYHYGMDILAGAALPFLTWWFVTRLEPGLKRGVILRDGVKAREDA